MRLLTRIEAIPLSTMEQGLRWDWESFPEWMDSLAQHALGVNVGALVPFNPLRLYVMGLAEARERVDATESRRLLDRQRGEVHGQGTAIAALNRTCRSSSRRGT